MCFLPINLLPINKYCYGLQQIPRAWLGRFTKSMITMNIYQSQGEHTLLIKHNFSSKLTALIVFMDVIIITRNLEMIRGNSKTKNLFV